MTPTTVPCVACSDPTLLVDLDITGLCVHCLQAALGTYYQTYGVEPTEERVERAQEAHREALERFPMLDMQNSPKQRHGAQRGHRSEI